MGGYGGSRGGGFSEQYRCYSVAMMQGNERQNVNHGGKSNVFPIYGITVSGAVLVYLAGINLCGDLSFPNLCFPTAFIIAYSHIVILPQSALAKLGKGICYFVRLCGHDPL